MSTHLAVWKSLPTFYARHKKNIFLALTFLLGVVVLYPSLDYQPLLAQGDHGRDLYAAQVSMNGQIPYKDYFWSYGPIMPYYYASWFKLLGTHIQAVLTGQTFLFLIAGTLIYLILTNTTVSYGLSLIGALWFWVFFPGFFYTYNHIGGVVLLLILLYLLILYLKHPKTVYLFWSLAYVFLLSLVKLNFGVTGLFCLLASIAGIDHICKNPMTMGKKIVYLTALVLPAFIFFVYRWFLRGLPIYAVRQCLPYFGGNQPYNISVWTGLGLLTKSILANILAGRQNFLFALIIIGLIARSARRLAPTKIGQKEKIRLLIAIGLLAFFYIVNVHEFLLSGVFYRSLWAKPFAYLLMFLFLSIGTRDMHKGVRILLYGTLLASASLNILETQFALKMVKTPSQYLGATRGKIFLGNPVPWIQTVTQTVSFLKTNLRKNELFFALPHDALYYFLTDKVSPTRQLIFFDQIKIPPEQEKEILAELEKNKVNWIVLSSRQHATEEYGLGILGKTYCPLIGEYIDQNFTTVTEFGDWVNEPGWAWNHGTRVLKRKQKTSPLSGSGAL